MFEPREMTAVYWLHPINNGMHLGMSEPVSFKLDIMIDANDFYIFVGV